MKGGGLAVDEQRWLRVGRLTDRIKEHGSTCCLCVTKSVVRVYGRRQKFRGATPPTRLPGDLSRDFDTNSELYRVISIDISKL